MMLAALCCPLGFTLHAPRPAAQAARVMRGEVWRAPPSPFLLVTEEEVEAAVEKAEKLWALALEARQKADQLSGEAESFAEKVAHPLVCLPSSRPKQLSPFAFLRWPGVL